MTGCGYLGQMAQSDLFLTKQDFHPLPASNIYDILASINGSLDNQ